MDLLVLILVALWLTGNLSGLGGVAAFGGGNLIHLLLLLVLVIVLLRATESRYYRGFWY